MESVFGDKADSVSFCFIFKYSEVLQVLLVDILIVHPSECTIRALGKQSEP